MSRLVYSSRHHGIPSLKCPRAAAVPSPIGRERFDTIIDFIADRYKISQRICFSSVTHSTSRINH